MGIAVGVSGAQHADALVGLVLAGDFGCVVQHQHRELNGGRHTLASDREMAGQDARFGGMLSDSEPVGRIGVGPVLSHRSNVSSPAHKPIDPATLSAALPPVLHPRMSQLYVSALIRWPCPTSWRRGRSCACKQVMPAFAVLAFKPSAGRRRCRCREDGVMGQYLLADLAVIL